MVNDKIVYLVFFVISIAIVSVVAHMDDSKSLASTEHDTENSFPDSENETGILSFMLGSYEDRDNKTNDGV